MPATTLFLLVLVALTLAVACDFSHPQLRFPRFAPDRGAPPPMGKLAIEVVPSERFRGFRPGYVFTTRDGVLGYHRDRAANAGDVSRCASSR